MNNPVVKYMLIGGVALVWGLIIARIFSSLSGDPPAINTGIVPLAPVIQNTRNDSFSLYADYPDPFLTEDDTVYVETAAIETTNIGNSAAPATNIPGKIPQPAEPIDIVCSGIITNPSTKTKMAIIRINGREIWIKERQKAGDITVLKIHKERVLIRFKLKRMELMVE